MASNPPFQVEDQTDEDFFDNLVSDDNDDHLGSTAAAKLVEGNDSDDGRAFENLTVEEELDAQTEEVLVASVVDKSFEGGLAENAVVAENAVTDCGFGGSGGTCSDNSEPFQPSGINTDNNDDGDKLGTCSTSGSPAGAKEIGWSSFYADSAENGGHGFGSYSDFFNNFGVDSQGKVENNAEASGIDHHAAYYGQNNEATQVYGSSAGDGESGQDTSSSQYWEELYPGWKFDANTGQWYQLNGYNGSNQTSSDVSAGDWGSGMDGKTEVSYLQHTAQSVGGISASAESGTTQSTVGWNQAPPVNNGYPEHMVFDPQYPGWYYDTISGAWQMLESYNQPSVHSVDQSYEQPNQNGYASAGDYTHTNGHAFSEHGQTDNYITQAIESHIQNDSWVQDCNNYNGILNNHANRHSSDSFHKLQSDGITSHCEANGYSGLTTFVPSENLNEELSKLSSTGNGQLHFSNDFYSGQQSTSVQHSFHHIQKVPSASITGRSSAGRPAHALVSFGFGGKLIVMKSQGSFQSPSFSSKDSVEGSISVLNMLEVVTGKTNGSVSGVKTCDYFHALTQQSYPGPLAGGNVSSKDLNRWIDERIATSESSDVDYRKGEALKLLFSLLKIACQHYGKLRSPFGGDTVLKENDTPESAVARLFASVKKNGSHYGAPSQCIQQLPSDGQILATALEVQNLLVSGRKIEALQCAQGGQLWGPALVLASQLGDQFYLDTVKQMALRQLVAGSPLRTLCLLIAGQPAEVFSAGNTNNNVSAPAQPAQLGTNCMLDDWEENLAVISANRTKDDELVILHLGDCLWRERSEITAAHICYLIAEANFESYSDSARLCLIGADHWKFPRTYASPGAIQRTELYEYSKLLGNSQFVLLPFQSYKIVYAHMLAEVGKVSESLKYCQAVLKSLKTGRAPEVETWRQSVLLLEDRVKVHQQSGYAANLAPGKLVSKLRNLIDSTAHLVVGGPPPPPVQSFSPGNTLVSDSYQQQAGPKVSGSQSTMAMSSLMPSASMEPMSEWAADGSRMTMHNRSVSEPDFGRTPRQVDGKEAAPSASQGKASTAGGGSRFSRFGFGSQLIQKTVGLVLRPRQDKQAKLGEKNKFYYDEKLKRWVEEGAEPPAEEGALAPPPTTAAFQNGTQDYNLKPTSNSWSAPTNGSPKFKHSSPVDHASGIPPIPNSNNQFSARGRMGVRSRYVDTFNQGGGNQVNFLQSSVVKPAAMATNAKFFVPTPVPTTEQTTAVVESEQRENVTGEPPSTSVPYVASLSAPQPSTTMPRYASLDNIERKENMIDGLSVSASNSRRVASWSGSFSNSSTPPKFNQIKSPTGSTMVSPPPFMPSPVGIGTFGDELQEVEL